MRRRKNMHFRKTYDQVLAELGGIDYSKQSEIKKPRYLYSDPAENGSRWKAGDPLKLPRKGKNYAIYFNLNAMRAGTYGLGGVGEKSALFKSVKNSMPPFFNEKGNKVAPHPIQRARTYFGGSIYSFVDPQNGDVVSHQRTAELDDVVFEIHKKVVRKIQESGSKTPCCFVEGTYIKPVSREAQQDYISEWFDGMDGHLELYNDGWRQVVFNPMRSDTFMYYDEGKDRYLPAYTAERVVMMSLPTPASQVARRSIPYLILAQYVNAASQTYEDTDTYIRRKKSNPMIRKNGRNLGYGTKNGAMLNNQLRTVARVAKELSDAIQDDDQVPDWVLSKATVAMDRLVVANNYIQSKLQGMTPNPRVNVSAAIKNARKVIKEIR